jgi:glutathione S-transferase
MLLYSGPLSLFARKVEIALAEKGLAFQRVMVPFTQERGYQPKHPEVLRINPKGQVPVLIDGDLELFDSTLIFEYLEDAYPRPPLYPAGPGPRARCRTIELLADEVLLPLIRPLMHRTEPPVADAAQQAERSAAARAAESALQAEYLRLQERLQGQAYFCGDFSVADIGLFMSLLFVQRLKGPDFSGAPQLGAWFDRVKARPSAARAAAEIAAADRALSPALGA